MTPDRIPEGAHDETPVVQTPAATVPAEAPYRHSWQSRLLQISYAIFAFEIGLFLVVFPWLGDAWSLNYFESLGPAFRTIWDGPYFRGAVTGLGFVNIYIGLLQVARMFRRAPETRVS
jgi:hypothetical protein